MKSRDVERLLADQPAPPPPDGLAERIKDEIPDRMELAPDLVREPKVVPFGRRRSWQIAAAAAVTAALAAAVTWQLRPLGLRPELLESTRGAGPERRSAPRQAPASAPASPAQAEPSTELELQEEISDGLREVVSNDRGRIAAPLHVEGRLETDAPRKDSQMAQPAAPSEPKGAAGETTLATGGKELRDQAAAAPELKVEALDKRSRQPADELAAGRVAAQAPVSATLDGTAVGRSRIQEYETASPRLEEQPSARPAPPSTGGTTEPNDQPYGDVFFREYGVNPFIDTEDDRLSTFGLDVDTGSYTVVRRYLRDGYLPPREAVRVEEIVNYFDYGDRPPRRGDFELSAEGAPSPFADGERYWIVRFAITARTVAGEDRPPAVLTFVVDTSGSMERENRLGLVKQALAELLDNLGAEDRVGLVVYGDRGEVLLEPTTDHRAIRSAIDRLQAAGSTNAEEGLVLGYQLAERYADEEGINRLILCSDGVANVGRTGPESILDRVARYAERGIELTTVGFGMGNYNDELMERLADTGDGRYAYVDTLTEARRIFAEELTGTLMTVARETKAQVELNPEVVSRYRLLGYENRDIADDRFRDPTVDAGEIGAGHTVTALYEIKLHSGVGATDRQTLATLRLRYQRPGDDQPVELEETLEVRDLARSMDSSSRALRLATLAAEYAEILKGAYWAKDGDLGEVLRRLRRLQPEYSGDARVAEFVGLVATAAELTERRTVTDDD